jgi:hypothetical protein
MWWQVYDQRQLEACGVYAIINRQTGGVYVGMTITGFYSRWTVHLKDLQGNRHSCEALQNAWNACGEDAFDWRILLLTIRDERSEEHGHGLRNALRVVEWREAQKYADRLYNSGLLARKPRYIR